MLSPAVTSFHFDTNDYPVEDRFEMWRDVISATHAIAQPDTGPAPFRTNIDLWHLGQIATSSGSFSAQSFARSMETIRHDHIDHIGLFGQGKGTRLASPQPISDNPAALQYGLTVTKFGPMIGHTGSLPGYQSFMGHDPERGATLVVMTNLQFAPDGQDTANQIANPVIGALCGA